LDETRVLGFLLWLMSPLAERNALSCLWETATLPKRTREQKSEMEDEDVLT
jgi:hypothetical protein